MAIDIKRAYEKPSAQDGRRILIDRLWPRGLKKQEVAIDEWRKDLAPSDELRRWFGHDPKRWRGFRRRYLAELAEREEELRELARAARDSDITLVFGARDLKHNDAVVLKERLEELTG
ncbi:MAG: DUF488 domain-containing protein [Gemmatimonadota bacterium]